MNQVSPAHSLLTPAQLVSLPASFLTSTEVDSFSTTLSEVANADIVLHVRDISHPHTEDQKRTVLKVLKDLGFDSSFTSTKMIEVWNKVDLLDKDSLLKLHMNDASSSSVPVVPVSALYSTNLEDLMSITESKANYLLGKSYHTIINSLDKQLERFNWLTSEANVTRLCDEEYVHTRTKEFPEGYVKFRVLLDEVTLRRYYLQFPDQNNVQNQPQKMSRKGMPPKDWGKSPSG